MDLSKESGKCRFAETGFGWKPSSGGDTFTLDHANIAAAQWSRAAKGYEIKILQRASSGIIQLDGFSQEDYDRLAKVFKNWYSTALENKEHALRGWNWGKAEFSKSELTFSVQNRPAFELSYSDIGNTNLAGRNEVAVEMTLPPTAAADTGANPQLGGARAKGTKAAAGRDQLVEMRFYIPGTATRKETEGEDAGSENGEEVKDAAALFYETLIDKAEIGETAGDTIATFLDVLHLTPRGRFDIDMYEASFRLRGKTYDYKIQYEAIKKFMVLPKPDETHCMLCIGLDPPLRQGQTRYPFVVMQFKKDEEVTIDLNLNEEELKSKYQDKLEPHYEEPLHHVVAKIFRGLANKKISSPAKDFITYASSAPFPPLSYTNSCADTETNMASSVPSRPARVPCTAWKRPSCSSPSPPHTSPTSRPSLSPSPVSAALFPPSPPLTSLSFSRTALVRLSSATLVVRILRLSRASSSSRACGLRTRSTRMPTC